MILTELFIASKARGLPRNISSKDLYNIKSLNLWGQNISDVGILRKLPQLQVVSLAVNNIRDLSPFSYLPHLRELYLRKNQISEPAQLLHLASLPLTHLWIEDNPVCAKIRDYRITVIRLLPNLSRLDDQEVTPRERRQADLLGPIQSDEVSSIFGPVGEDNGNSPRGMANSFATTDSTVREARNTALDLDSYAVERLAQPINFYDEIPVGTPNRRNIRSLPGDFVAPRPGPDAFAAFNSQQQAPLAANGGKLRYEDHVSGAGGVVSSFEWSMPKGQIRRLAGQKNGAVGGGHDDAFKPGAGLRRANHPHYHQLEASAEAAAAAAAFLELGSDHRSRQFYQHPDADYHLNVGRGLDVVQVAASHNPRARIPHAADTVGIEVSRNDPPRHLYGASTQVRDADGDEEKHIRRSKNVAGLEGGRGHVRGAGAQVFEENAFPVVEARKAVEDENGKPRRPTWLRNNAENVLQSIRQSSADGRSGEHGLLFGQRQSPMQRVGRKSKCAEPTILSPTHSSDNLFRLKSLPKSFFGLQNCRTFRYCLV
ncbi:hypothetical protein DFJ73DRAFT_261650 [Zopfochytrium polystomum]|nr:hypothetical protein DFJ73DRAFT_261650 [Zopfochytrium polystomum]